MELNISLINDFTRLLNHGDDVSPLVRRLLRAYHDMALFDISIINRRLIHMTLVCIHHFLPNRH